jgi:hypothetical protein
MGKNENHNYGCIFLEIIYKKFPLKVKGAKCIYDKSDVKKDDEFNCTDCKKYHHWLD